jgi:hypothetical protein
MCAMMDLSHIRGAAVDLVGGGGETEREREDILVAVLVLDVRFLFKFAKTSGWGFDGITICCILERSLIVE